MSEEISSNITSVKIKSLWGKFDLEWNLNPDVNILSGINGSGKSTILNCIADVLTQSRKREIFLLSIVEEIIVSFKNRGYSFMKSDMFEKERGLWARNTNESNPVVYGDVDIISTFDNEIIETNGRPDINVKTELDRKIFFLQKDYLDYQLKISKKVFEILKRGDSKEILEIRKQQERFLEIIDNLFKETGKKINRDNNEISFLSGEEELSPYQLSSGEKQILVILLTVLVQDNKPSILLMDEPEISLHFDWQKKLIQYIRELNPNAQIIIATHSPALVMEGWKDKVFEVRDLIKAIPAKK